MSKVSLDTLYAAYAAAIDGADYDTAIANLLKAQALLDTNPDIAYGGAGTGGNSIRFRASEIPRLIAECRRLKAEVAHAAGGPFQRTKIIYARATT